MYPLDVYLPSNKDRGTVERSKVTNVDFKDFFDCRLSEVASDSSTRFGRMIPAWASDYKHEGE